MKQTIFTLAGARSGTVYLRHLFRNNVPGCVTRHETFFDWGNPAMFGHAIYDADAGRRDRIQELLQKKRRYIEKLRGSIYFESSHAFLKSSYVAAMDVFPELRLVHLIRDPRAVALSEAYREQWRRRVHAPFHFYMGDDQRRHFVWALTGNEPIFREVGDEPLTLLQWYVLQWIEIENRASEFLDRHSLHDRCFALQTEELNDPSRVQAMFDFLELPTRDSEPNMRGRKNRSFGYRRAGPETADSQLKAVLRRVPAHLLRFLDREPYRGFAWARELRCLEPPPADAAGTPSAQMPLRQ